MVVSKSTRQVGAVRKSHEHRPSRKATLPRLSSAFKYSLWCGIMLWWISGVWMWTIWCTNRKTAIVTLEDIFGTPASTYLWNPDLAPPRLGACPTRMTAFDHYNQTSQKGPYLRLECGHDAIQSVFMVTGNGSLDAVYDPGVADRVWESGMLDKHSPSLERSLTRRWCTVFGHEASRPNWAFFRQLMKYQSYAKCVLGTSYIRKSNRSERKMKNKMGDSPCRFIRYNGPGTRYLDGEPDDWAG